MRHWSFIAECLGELDIELERLGQRLVLRRGSMTDILDALHKRHRVAGLYSHEETGNAWTYKRDQAVGAWARGHSVPWQEGWGTGSARRVHPPLGSRTRVHSRGAHP